MGAKREIGKSGLFITPLMLGGNVFGWTADEKASFAVLDAFVARGGDAIDTADVYSAWAPGHEGGESERLIGAWLKRSGKRGQVMIGTKVGMWQKRSGIGRENIIAACEDSLKRLGVDVIDLYWLHRDDEATPPEEYVAALEALYRSGKIRAFGASNFKPGPFAQAIAEAKRRGLAFAALQPEYHLLNRGVEQELAPLCVREQVSLLPYYGLANGYLTGKYRSPADKAQSVRGARMDQYMQGKGPQVLAALDAVSARHGATLAQAALAWLMARPAVAAPVASATSAAQVEDLMGAISLTLSAEDIAALNAASA
ncbi:MAG: aldo/keto reductase [Hyphomonadaceae bacterium]|nr:aldo/keto reductase [Hyphomonadaceae bacterium]MBX3510399.1 aldo/keto reductase [Hyphomonadaceae bacterium]